MANGTSNLTVTLDTGDVENLTFLTSTLEPITDDFDLGISKETLARFSLIVNAILTPIICVVGLIINGLGIGVLWRNTKQQRMSVYQYLCALTIMDVLFLATGVVRASPGILIYFDAHLSNYIETHMKLGIVYLDMIFSYTSSAMIVVMSFDRLVALVRPLHVKSTFLAKYPLCVIFLSFLFNTVFLLPLPINSEVVMFQDRNRSEYLFRFKPYTKGFMNVFVLIQSIVHNFVPITCLIFTSIAIPLQHYRIIQNRKEGLNKKTTSVANKQMKITWVVVIIAFLYVLLSAPTFVIKVLQFVNPDYGFEGKYRMVLWFTVDLNNLFSYINAANDFFIYIIVSNQYRDIFKTQYCMCCGSRAEDRDGSSGNNWSAGPQSIEHKVSARIQALQYEHQQQKHQKTDHTVSARMEALKNELRQNK